MSYYFEIWLRGFAKDYLRKISTKNNKSYHPHITLVRPFEIHSKDEEKIKNKVISFCKNDSSFIQ